MDDSEGLKTTPNVAYPLTEHVLPNFYTENAEEIFASCVHMQRTVRRAKETQKRITPVRVLDVTEVDRLDELP